MSDIISAHRRSSSDNIAEDHDASEAGRIFTFILEKIPGDPQPSQTRSAPSSTSHPRPYKKKYERQLGKAHTP